MKITEKMYLLAKDVVEEYEKNQGATNESLNFIPQTENRFELECEKTNTHKAKAWLVDSKGNWISLNDNNTDVEVKAGGVNIDFELNEKDLSIGDEWLGEHEWCDEVAGIVKEQCDNISKRTYMGVDFASG